MNASQRDLGTTAISASNVLLTVIILVIFSVFFQTDHNVNFTVNAINRSTDGAAISGIAEGNIFNRLALIFLAAFSAVLFLTRRRFEVVFRGFFGYMLIGYLVWIVLSLFWADDSTLVARRIVVFVFVYFSAFSISGNIAARQLPTIVLWTTTLFLMVGIYTERSLGTWWLGSEGYRFAGTCHPEGQGVNCAMLLLAAATISGQNSRLMLWISRVMMTIGFLFLLLTRSRGPFMGLVIAILVYKTCSRRGSGKVAYVYIFAVLICVAILVFGDAFFRLVGFGMLLGRQDEQLSDFNGRRELWTECLDFARSRPFGGYGFGGFWTEDRARTISDSYGWLIESSHSMYLETVLDIGLIGLFIFGVLLIVAWGRAYRGVKEGREEGYAFSLGVLTLWIADGLLSTLVTGRGFVTFLLLVVFFVIARESPMRTDRTRSVADG